MANRDLKLPKFALIKQYVQGQIESADWPVGTCIPSETELATTFNVSRMTARRALQELADQGLLSRVPGRGSFVAEPEVPVAQVEIYNQLHSAQTAGTYSNRIISLESIPASAKVAELLHMASGDVVYQLIVVHLDRGRPLQWQHLYINPLLAPALLKQKFNKISLYLTLTIRYLKILIIFKKDDKKNLNYIFIGNMILFKIIITKYIFINSYKDKKIIFNR